MLDGMLRALVVDDELPARRRLIRLIEQLAQPAQRTVHAGLPDIAVVGEAGDGEEALELLTKTAASLLFLDIHMPGMDGLALAQRYHGLPPIVFTTAYDQHAVAAFAVHAVDYLLKPISAERLAQAVVRAAQRVQVLGKTAGSPPTLAQDATAAMMTDLLARSGPSTTPRLVVHDRGSLRLFDAATITRLWSTDKYTAFHADGREQLTPESLSELEARLCGHGFLRVHRSELVNLRQVRALHLGEDGSELELTDGQRARVSRRLLPQVRAALVPGRS